MEKLNTTNENTTVNKVEENLIENPYYNKDLSENIEKKDAKQIVEENKLEKLLGEMYNSLIYERSKDPPLFMVNQ